MLYLVISLLALAVGPVLAIGARRFRSTTIALDSFVLVVLGGLVALHILPHSLEVAGLPALVVAIGAFVLTGAAERTLRSGVSARGRLGRRLFFALALLGLGFHAVVDGLALTGAEVDPGHVHLPGDPEHDQVDGGIWALAVLLHRIPVAISLWWIVAPLIGLRAAILSMLVLATGTIAGYSVGGDLLATASERSIALFEALLCGTLMHVVLHADLPPAPRGANPWLIRSATLVGLASGIAVVTVVEGGHSHDHGAEHGPDTLDSFLALALESAPALLLAFAAVGLARAFLPRAFIRRSGPARPFADALRGVAIGLPLPVCSCGVVPMYRDLVRRGAAVATSIAFLVATPELEFAAVLLTWQLLGPEVTLARIAAAGVLAIVVAIGVARVARSTSDVANDDDAVESRPTGLAARIRLALRTGFVESVDETAAWLLLGLGIAAFLTPMLDPTALAGLPSAVGVPLAAVIGMPLYVCASGSTPLAAVLVAKGLSPGAAIAFLLTGPATNITTFGMLSRLHDRRTAIAFAGLMFAGATCAGWITDALLGPITPPAAAVVGHEHASTWQWIALGLIAAVVGGSLLRQGIRRFLGQLFDTPPLAVLTGGSSGDTCCDDDDPHAGTGHQHHHHGHGPDEHAHDHLH